MEHLLFVATHRLRGQLTTAALYELDVGFKVEVVTARGSWSAERYTVEECERFVHCIQFKEVTP